MHQLPSVLWHCWLGGRKGIQPVKYGEWWRWALLSLDGVAPSRMVSVSASVNVPLHHKVQKFSSSIGSSGWSPKRDVKRLCVVWCGVCVQHFCVQLYFAINWNGFFDDNSKTKLCGLGVDLGLEQAWPWPWPQHCYHWTALLWFTMNFVTWIMYISCDILCHSPLPVCIVYSFKFLQLVG